MNFQNLELYHIDNNLGLFDQYIKEIEDLISNYKPQNNIVSAYIILNTILDLIDTISDYSYPVDRSLPRRTRLDYNPSVPSHSVNGA